jgi:hypothetical protein
MTIHLVIGGRRPRPVKNTSKPHKGMGYLAKQQHRLHLRRLAHAAILKSLPSSANPAAYRSPGSMNYHK